ncbi:23240_t:CDS:1, partial [Entrophospora sp. SA101]
KSRKLNQNFRVTSNLSFENSHINIDIDISRSISASYLRIIR